MSAAETQRLRGQLGVAVALLRECIGPLEVSAAVIESDDGDQMEELIERVQTFVAADSNLHATGGLNCAAKDDEECMAYGACGESGRCVRQSATSGAGVARTVVRVVDAATGEAAWRMEPPMNAARDVAATATGCAAHGLAHPCEACAAELPLRDALQRLADLLDEDQFAHCEDVVRQAGVEPPANGVASAGRVAYFGKAEPSQEDSAMGSSASHPENQHGE